MTAAAHGCRSHRMVTVRLAQDAAAAWLIPAAILLCGGLFPTFYLAGDAVNRASMTPQSFYKVQTRLLCHVIHKAWGYHVSGLHTIWAGTSVSLCCDARCNYPVSAPSTERAITNKSISLVLFLSYE